jgi:hypothetical protein
VIAPETLYKTSSECDHVFLALRELLSLHREIVDSGAEGLADLLYEQRFLSHRPDVFVVEVALEALRMEGEVLG